MQAVFYNFITKEIEEGGKDSAKCQSNSSFIISFLAGWHSNVDKLSIEAYTIN
jgi:hypothetical protein